MKTIYRFFALCALSLALANSSQAQVNIGGQTMNNDIVSWGDLYNISFTAHNYGTARSMAMGNAFTALGADLISASLNPAGIGMYMSNDFSLSLMMQFAKSPTKSSVDGYEVSPFNTSVYDDHIPIDLPSPSGAGVQAFFRLSVVLINARVECISAELTAICIGCKSLSGVDFSSTHATNATPITTKYTRRKVLINMSKYLGINKN